jgi:sugar lactone lactonase YvrE
VTVFVSYSSRDRLALDNLVAALRRTQLPVWFDDQLGGGEAWWSTILEQIRGAEVFVVALSRNYLGSKPCLAELGYAQDLGRPVLPVQIGPVNVRVNPLGALQIIDYQNPTTETGIELIVALQNRRAQAAPLPDPLPEPPAVPFAYLIRMAASMAGPELSPAKQIELLSELRAALDEDGDDPTVRGDIAELLTTLRDRPDTTWRTRTEVDTVLASIDELAHQDEPAPESDDVAADLAGTRAPGGPALVPADSTAPPAAESDQPLDSPRPVTPPAEDTTPSVPPQPFIKDRVLTSAPTQQRPREDSASLRSEPETRTADRRPPMIAWCRHQRRQVQLGLIAALVVILAAAGITGYLLLSAHPSSRQVALPFTGLHDADGVAVDSSGAVYVADQDNGRVLKLAGGSSTQTVLPFTGLGAPFGVAVDSSGTVYVTDYSPGRVVKLAAGASTQAVLPFTGLAAADGVAVDSSGSVYVTDYSTSRVLKLAGGSSTQTVLPFTGLKGPGGVAVDSSGTVYVADQDNSQVVKLAAGSSTQTVLPFTGLSNPGGVAVDSSGTVYVADSAGNRVVKLAAGSSTQAVLPFTGLSNPGGVAVDSSGAVYVADYGNRRVVKLAAG